jgi:glycosyltransferase involved in cell wall biosynthesis
METFAPQHRIIASVIVCSLNGAARIGECLDSINRQTFKNESYEVIVIDDGSTDSTSDIARLCGARIVRFEKNRGIPSARNAGYLAASGEVAVYIDDDCVADCHWLENLVRIFEDKDVVAAGGRILAYSNETISEQYMAATGYGNPPRPSNGLRRGVVGKLWSYFSNMYSPIMLESLPIMVNAVYTANAAYRKQALVDLGGFDESLRTSEDSDISARIRARGRVEFFL